MQNMFDGVPTLVISVVVLAAVIGWALGHFVL